MSKFRQIMAVVLAAGMLSAPVSAQEEQAVRVTALKGPTAMGLVKMMDEAGYGTDEAAGYQFEIAAAPDVVAPLLAKGETDIAAVPANLASVLYNNTKGGVRVIAINTLGVLYIVDTSGSVSSVSDLKGRTIYASGKGSTPEYALNYILSGNGIDPDADVQIEWKSEHAECLAALLEDPEGIAMLPQPFVTTAMMKDDSIQVVLDLSEEWDKLQEGSENPSGMITGVAVVRTAFAEENPEAVTAFLEAYADSVAYVNEDTAGAAALVGAYDIVPQAVAEKALPACNITLITGQEMADKLAGYLQVLFDANPESVGGALPEEDFFFIP
ncbi:MAG: ABC transporter substrate-binding protein [Lachnospiraceae bacterium]|nr:ABC transporter substrate-binding protein [Lachnospiraceae bacterium]